MLRQHIYTKLYGNYDVLGYRQLLFYNEISKDALLFNGYQFYFQAPLLKIPDGFSEAAFDQKRNGDKFEIESIREDGDIFYIKFQNGDLFQLYFFCDDNTSDQILSVFEKEEASKISTPLGISVYEAVLRGWKDAREAEIIDGIG